METGNSTDTVFSFGGRLTPMAKLSEGYRSAMNEQTIRKRTARTTNFLREILGDDVAIDDDTDGFLDQIKNGEILVRLG